MSARRLASLAGAAWLIGAAAAGAQVKSWPSESVPRPLKAPKVAFPPYEMRTLPNGLQVVVVPHREQPAISIRMLVGSGAAADPADKPGVANLVASVLDQGTATRSARELAEAVDALGGRLQIGAGADLTFGSLTVLSDGFDAGLALLSDVVRTPAFAAEELDRQRRQMQSALAVSAQDPDYIATAVFRRLVYGQHPYASTGTGTADSLDGILRSDLVEYHQRHYVPNNCILALVGDLDPAGAFAAAERAFGSWPRRDVPPSIQLPPPAAARRIVVIDKPDAVQTEIRIGQLGIPRNSNDYTDLDLAVRVLGGEGANRLQQVLRVQRGLTYGASATLDAMRRLGHIMAETDTRTEATGEVVRVITDEFFRVQRDPVAGREFEDAKAYLAGSFPLTIETPDAISTRILTALFFGLPLKDLGALADRVNAVTPEDLERVTRTYLKPDRLTIVLVGNARGFVDQLPKLGLRQVTVIPLAELDLDPSAPSLRVSPGLRALKGMEPLRLAPRPVQAEWDAAKPLVMKAVAASGGLDALQRVKTVHATTSTLLSTPGGPWKATTTTRVEYPGRMRVDASLPPPQGSITQVIADGAAWFSDVNGPRDAPEGIRLEMVRSLRCDWIALLRSAATDQMRGRRLADTTGLAGRQIHVVELWPDGTMPVQLSLEAESGQLVSLSYETRGPGGTARMTETFGDFRPVDGLLVPFRSVLLRGDQLLFERTITSFQVNVPLAAALFVKPS